MDEGTIIPMLVALIGALGLKEGWNIWKKKIETSNSFKSSIREDNKNRIGELEKKIEGLYKRIEELIEDNGKLKSSLARLEERILLTAKNRVKKKTDI